MGLPVDTPVSGGSLPEWGRWAAGESAVAVAVGCSLVLAGGGGYVFYASLRPISIAEGYGAVLFDFPWIMAFLVLAVAWVAGPVILLVVGLVHLLRHARHRWWSAAGWLVALAGDIAFGFLVMHGYRLLFSAAPLDLDGTPLGPSRWAPAGPYWLALVAAGGELAVGPFLIAFVSTSPGKLPRGRVAGVLPRAARWLNSRR